MAVRSSEIINRLGNSSVYFGCIILEIHLMIQRHSIDFALGPISFFIISQMLPLEVLS